MSLIYRDERKSEWSSIFESARRTEADRNFLDQARGLLDGPPVPPERGVPWLAHECVELVTDAWDAVVVVTGKEGVSKSTFALRFSLEIMKLVGRSYEWSLLCYSAREILKRYRMAVRGDPIWFDEGARGLWAGETLTPEQNALTKALTLVRSTGAILIICAPDIWGVAKKVRGRRSRFWVHVESRGTRRAPAASMARFFERDDRLHFVPSNSLGMYPSRRCPTITYDPFPSDDPILAEYERMKKTKLDEFYVETDAELDAAESRRLGRRRASRRGLNGAAERGPE